MIALTERRLKAIAEALSLRLAGEIDSGIPRQVYQDAVDWAEIMLEPKFDARSAKLIARTIIVAALIVVSQPALAEKYPPVPGTTFTNKPVVKPVPWWQAGPMATPPARAARRKR